MPDRLSAQLILRDGTRFEGLSFGANQSSYGEVVFATGMVGYPEALTDPSFHGQILTMTYPLIGNYGVPKNGFESDRIHIQGLIVQDYTAEYSHHTAVESLGVWLQRNKIPAICGIDTRAVTKHLRKHGVMLGQIVIGRGKPLDDIVDPNKKNLVVEVSIAKPKTYGRGGHLKIIAVDCGIKENSIRHFLRRQLEVKRVPWDYDYLNELRSDDYDGLFISNGPGDPATLETPIIYLREALKIKKPIFGICLGCQLLGIAAGAQTYKLKYGHRSQNQPCIQLGTNRCHLTTHNHGYAVKESTIPRDWEVWLRNANDDTVEGLRHKRLPFFSSQFHPEANPGPQDTEFLFDMFVDAMKKNKRV